MSEQAGGNGVSGTVQRSNTDLSQALTVSLLSSDTTEASVPTTVVIPAGATSQYFAVLPVDDRLLDGPQTVQISASAPGFTFSSTPPSGFNPTLTVTDFETLAVTTTNDIVAENAGAAAIMGTVTRSNLDDLSSALQVALSSSDTTGLTVPATVVIPAGQASFTFPINAIDDTVVDGTQSVNISASAPGYVTVGATVLVADNEGNSIPVALNQQLSTNEDTVISGSMSGTDADGDPLTFSIISNPGHGSIKMGTNGAFTYTPKANFYGPDSFRYRANDGKADSGYATVSIVVQPVNDPPVANPDSYQLNEDQPLSTVAQPNFVTRIQMTSDPGDPLGQGLTYDFSTTTGSFFPLTFTPNQIVSLDYYGSSPNSSWHFYFATGTNSPLTVGTYTGAAKLANFSTGTPGLNVTVNGRSSDTATGNFTINEISFDANKQLKSLSATFEIHYESQTPALRGTVLYQELVGPPGGVLFNDTDLDSNTITASLVTQPSHGSVVMNPDGTFVYTPVGNYNGTDSFTYQASDGTLSSNVSTVSLIVNAVNDPPSIQDQVMSIPELSSNGSIVGTVAASDPDAGQTLTYAITSTSLPGAFAINPATGQITVANGALLDHEQIANVTLTVKVTDSGNPPLSGSGTVTIAVSDVNEAPVVSAATFMVNENAINGTSVGVVAASDPDAGQTRTFAITGGNVGSAFTINSSTGQISVANSSILNFETIPQFNLTVTATDNGAPVKSGSATVVIKLLNVNESPIVTPASFTIDENTVSGTSIGTVLASDPDAGQTRAFSITAGNVGNAFMINPTSGLITVNNGAALDFETTPQFNLTITATDNGTPVKSGSATISINLLDANDAPIVSASTFTLNENTPAGTSVGTVSASDQDAGQTRTFAITAGNINTAFAINPSTGLITVSNAAALNFETTPNFGLTITVTDNGVPARSSSALISVNLINVNEAPVVSSASYTTNENSVNGTAIGTVAASDPDAGQTRKFAITAGNTGNAFTVNQTTGLITVNNSAALNFATTPQFNLTVTATDNGTPAKSGSATIIVKLLKVNKAPVVSPATFSINENSINGTSVGTVTATDPDAGQTRTFAITAGNTANAFSIDASSGLVKVNNTAALDFETTPQFNLTITATDNGTPVKSGSATIVVKLLNVNDAPVVTPATFSINENSVNGTTVGTVVAIDPDVGQTRTFAITAGNVNSAFSINATTGVVKVNSAAALNFETTPQFNLTITATDNGTPVKSGSATVVVKLLNVNEAPVVTPATFSINENSIKGTLVGTVIASDPDAGQTHTFAISAGNTRNAFSIDARTGALKVNTASALDFEVTPQFNLTIVAFDNGSPAKSGSATIVIHLINVIEPTKASASLAPIRTTLNLGTTLSSLMSKDPDA